MTAMKLPAMGKFVSKCDLLLLYLFVVYFRWKVCPTYPGTVVRIVNDCKISDKFLFAMLTTSSEFHILSFHVAIQTRMADIHNLTKMERQCINTVPF